MNSRFLWPLVSRVKGGKDDGSISISARKDNSRASPDDKIML